MMDISFSIDDLKGNQSVEYKESLEGYESKEMDDPTEICRCNTDAKFQDHSIDNCHINKDAN